MANDNTSLSPPTLRSPTVSDVGSAFSPPDGGTRDRSTPSGRDPITDGEMERAFDVIGRLIRAYDAKLVGQRAVRTSLLVTLIAEGHVLLESVPGLAKTTAAATLAQTVDGTFARIQCTPDLLPSDIIGTQVFDPNNASFSTRLGPVHANFVLLDEINRSSAKTQSAMLEAMQERQTSIGGDVFRLPQPFMVLATQNPIEEEGTYPLPQAQMDRFLLKEIVDYPNPDEEFEVLNRIDKGVLGPHAPDADTVLTLGDVKFLIDLSTRVYVDDTIKRYIVRLVQATRRPSELIGRDMASYVEAGASPRGAIALQQVARALAMLNRRTHVVPDDVRAMRHPVLRHRLRLTFQAVADDVRPESIVDAIVSRVPTP